MSNVLFPWFRKGEGYAAQKIGKSLFFHKKRTKMRWNAQTQGEGLPYAYFTHDTCTDGEQ